VAIETLKNGATDYVLKTRLTRLVPAVHRALREAQERTDRRLAEVQLRESHKQLRALSVYLQHVREEERTRIAREVHDELGQALTSCKLDAS
jgi:signal transduction histidine kinase